MVYMFDLWCVFFFFKQKTAYEMRISDWSSDVCSSDLPGCSRAARPPARSIHAECGECRSGREAHRDWTRMPRDPRAGLQQTYLVSRARHGPAIGKDGCAYRANFAWGFLLATSEALTTAEERTDGNGCVSKGISRG